MYKKMEKMREEEEDRKILHYTIEKEKRDIENDRIQAEKRAEREQELARLRAAQEKVSWVCFLPRNTCIYIWYHLNRL